MSLTLRWKSPVPLFSILIFATFALAQDSGTVRVYRDQFVQLHTRTRALLSRVEQRGREAAAADSPETLKVQLEMQEEIRALTKLVHALSEDAAKSYVEGLERNVERMRAGQNLSNPNQGLDKGLLFVQSGCDEMGFVLSTLSNYLDSGDRAFLGFAKRGDDLTASIEAVL